ALEGERAGEKRALAAVSTKDDGAARRAAIDRRLNAAGVRLRLVLIGKGGVSERRELRIERRARRGAMRLDDGARVLSFRRRRAAQQGQRRATHQLRRRAHHGFPGSTVTTIGVAIRLA